MFEDTSRDLGQRAAIWDDGARQAFALLKARLAAAAVEYRRPTAIVALYVGLAWAACATHQLTFVGWRLPLGTAAALALVGLVYVAWRPSPPLAEALLYAAFWIVFVQFGCILTYAAAAVGSRYPLADSVLANMDTMLGFDWEAWSRWARSGGALTIVLRAAYFSLPFQIIGSILLFSLRGVRHRNYEFLSLCAVSLLLTCIVWALVPAIGPRAFLDPGAAGASDIAQASAILALRSGETSVFALSELQGIVSLPSYHTVLAMVCVFVHRGLRWSFPVMLLLNFVMLISIPSEGPHYLVDMIAGAAVALAAAVIVRSFARGGESNAAAHAATK
jgi:hypothetical protein